MTAAAPVVGVLALQGDYQKHRQMLGRIGVASCAVRTSDDFARVDRLIIPGGESTVIADLLQRFDLQTPFTAFIRTRPVWGTCAGMVLLAAQVNDESVNPYGVIDIDVDRNGYGRQYFSDIYPARFQLDGVDHELDLVFIRAPRVTRVGTGVTVLLNRENDPVLLAQKNVLVSSFHPELTASTFLHRYFAFVFTSV
jgi:pyridoxal 5'-phosphate synthase pdxT subunit